MKRILLITLPVFIAASLLAQESMEGLKFNPNANSQHWYASPWIWVAGAAIVIVILVLLSNGKDSSQQKPSKK